MKIIKFKLFLENLQKSVKEFPEDIEIIEYVSRNVSNKNYIYDIVKIYNTSLTSDIDTLISEYEFYIRTKTYLYFNKEDYISLNKLKNRNKLFKEIDFLPKLFKVNNRDLRRSYDYIGNTLEYLISIYISNISHKKQNTKDKIDRVIQSSNKTIDELIDLIEDKYNIDNFDSLIDKDIFTDIETNSNNLILDSDIIYNKNDKYIIRITSNEAMSFIASNTFWCHASSNNHKSYYTYSYDCESLVFIDYTIDSDDIYNIVVATKDFYISCNNGSLFDIIKLYDDNRSEYDNIINDNIDHIGLYNRHNDVLYDPISYLKDFLEDDFSFEFISDLII